MTPNLSWSFAMIFFDYVVSIHSKHNVQKKFIKRTQLKRNSTVCFVKNYHAPKLSSSKNSRSIKLWINQLQALRKKIIH